MDGEHHREWNNVLPSCLQWDNSTVVVVLLQVSIVLNPVYPDIFPGEVEDVSSRIPDNLCNE